MPTVYTSDKNKENKEQRKGNETKINIIQMNRTAASGLQVPQIVVTREFQRIPLVKIRIEGASSSESEEDDNETKTRTRLRPDNIRCSDIDRVIKRLTSLL